MLNQKIKITLFCLVLSFGAWAADSQLPKRIKLCTVEWSPYTIVDENSKQITGKHTALVKKLFKALGMKTEISEMPWKRCLEEVKQGKIHGVYSASKNAERLRFLKYPHMPLQKVSYVVVVLKNNKYLRSWRGIKSLLPQPVGVPLGFSIVTELREAQLEVDDGASNDEQNILKLLKGRVKSIIIESKTYKKLRDRMTLKDKLTTLDPVYIYNKQYFVAIAKRQPFSEELSLKIDRTLRRIFRKAGRG